MNDKSNKTTSVNGTSGGFGRAVANRIACAGVAVAVQFLGNAAKVATSLGASDIAKTPYSVLSYAFRSATRRSRTSQDDSMDSKTVEASNHVADEILQHRWEDDGGRVVE